METDFKQEEAEQEAPQTLITLRPHQEDPFWREDIGLMVLLWRRRAGKSLCMAGKSLRQMMEKRDLTNLFLSASIRLGTEFIRKEAEVWKFVTQAFRATAEAKGKRLTSNADGLDLDAVCDLFEHQKLETRIWHDNTSFSRSLVLAPNPDTAVGYGGNIYLDEFGRVPEFKDILEAILPFLDENRDLRAIMASTPPPDDAHYSWELTVPPSEEFAVNPKGNWYLSEAGFWVHRVDAWDAYAGGMPMFDVRTREPLTPEEHLARAFDKTAWWRNYGVRYIRGGTSAVGALALQEARHKGHGVCVGIDVTEELLLS